MIPPLLDIVNVDPSFLYTLYELAAGLFTLGFVLSLLMVRRRMGPAGVTMWSSKRKRTPILFHEGKDGILRFWNTARSFAGNWRAGSKREMTILPESKSVKQITKGPPMGIASANGVATLSPQFLYDADKFTENFGTQLPEKVKMGPTQIAQYLNDLRYREAEIRGILAMIERVQKNEVSVEDAVNVIMAEQGYDQSDDEKREEMTKQLMAAMASKGQAYRDELERILAEKRIKFKEGGWKIEWERVGRPKSRGGLLGFFTSSAKTARTKAAWQVKYLYTAVPVTMLNYIAYMPGATIDDLQTALLEAEQAAKLERTEDKSQQFRWITLGIVVFIIMIGMYVVMQQLRLFG